MNKLVCLLVIVGSVAAQKWDGPNENYGHGGYRRPVAPAPLDNHGRVIETPEVARLKAEHFAAHDAALRANPPGRGYEQNNYEAQQEYQRPQQLFRPQEQQRFRDYTGQGERGPQQFYDSENEVDNQYNDNYEDRDRGYESNNKEEPRWRGPLAKIEFTSDGKFIKETPEVAHARQQHLAALNAAKSSKHYQSEPEPNYGPQQNNYGPEQQNYDDGSYRGEGESQQYNGGNSWNNGNQNDQGRGYNSQSNGYQDRRQGGNQQQHRYY